MDHTERGIMNITFLIGNGFDINIGLKTSYLNFYDYFDERASEENMLRKWIDKSDKLWSDLETGLGVSTEKITGENEETFYEDKLELIELLADYLQLEQSKVNVKGKEVEVAKELARSLLGVANEMPNAQNARYKEILNTYQDENRVFQFVSFNYTNTLDQFVSVTKEKITTLAEHKAKNGHQRKSEIGSITHIHGTVDGEMILGVNDLSQIKNSALQENSFFRSVFIKTEMNQENDLMNEDVAMKAIDNSRIVCIYGMSMGETDNMWWEKIIKWLKKDIDNLLIIYYYKKSMIGKRKQRISSKQFEREVITRLLKQGGEESDALTNPIAKQIFIITNSSIFSFRNILFPKV